MILLYILIAILYLLTVYFSIYTYYEMRKQNEELENRILELEKRDNMNAKYVSNCFMELYDMINEKDGDTMACKKGRGGRKK